VPGAEALDFRDVHAFDEKTAHVLAIGPGDASRIYRTTDGGATWTKTFANPDSSAIHHDVTLTRLHQAILQQILGGVLDLLIEIGLLREHAGRHPAAPRLGRDPQARRAEVADRTARQSFSLRTRPARLVMLRPVYGASADGRRPVSRIRCNTGKKNKMTTTEQDRWTRVKGRLRAEIGQRVAALVVNQMLGGGHNAPGATRWKPEILRAE